MWRFFLGLPLDLVPPLRRAAGACRRAIRWFAFPDLLADPAPMGPMLARMLAGGAAGAAVAACVLGDGHDERFFAFVLGQCCAVLGQSTILIQGIVQERRDAAR